MESGQFIASLIPMVLYNKILTGQHEAVLFCAVKGETHDTGT